MARSWWFCLAAAFCGFQSSSAVRAAAPQLVIFISDDHSYLDSSVAGSADAPTPNMRRLAQDGMTLTHVFAPSPACAPSRAAFLTGLTPIRNGAMLNHQPPREEVAKLPPQLKSLGYEVVAIGKVAHYNQGHRYGFDHVSNETYHDDTCVDVAVEFLRQRTSEQPLCLFVGTNWPHVPWPQAPRDADPQAISIPRSHVDTPETRAARLQYLAAVEKFDTDLGKVYDAAYETLGKNTVFIHFSDHGAQWPFGKWNLYDAGTRVPFFAVWPDHIAPASQSDALANLIDLGPTLLELAGGAAMENIDGKSLAPVLLGQATQHRDALFTTHSSDGRMNDYPMRSIRTRRWRYIQNLNPEGEYFTHIDRGQAGDGAAYWRSWVRDAEHNAHAQFVVERYAHRPADELYDLEKDPEELKNLANEPQLADVLVDLRRQLHAEMKSQGDRGMESERASRREFQQHQQRQQQQRQEQQRQQPREGSPAPAPRRPGGQPPRRQQRQQPARPAADSENS